MTAGYSKRPLSQKLGIKEGQRIFLIGAPEGYLDALGPLPESARVGRHLRGKKDFIQFFTRSLRELERRLPSLVRALDDDGMLWVSWPKKSSGVAADLDGNLVRSRGLEAGLVDVKVCAVDDVWSGLKFVYRKRDRGGSG